MFRSPRFQAVLALTGALGLFFGPEPALSQVSEWDRAIKLGDEYRQQGRYREAEESYREALREAQAFGTKDALSCLAQTYAAADRYIDALSTYQRLLDLQQKTLGTGNPEVAATMSSLAFILRKTGHKREAQAMEARSKALLPRL
jgi:tetratricopeptide (TPR) repeat protein